MLHTIQIKGHETMLNALYTKGTGYDIYIEAMMVLPAMIGLTSFFVGCS